MTPDLDGFEICKRFRDFSSVPTSIVIVFEEDSTIIHNLNAGTDDYITKPFFTRELLS